METDDLVTLAVAGAIAYVAYLKFAPSSKPPASKPVAPSLVNPISSPTLQSITFDPSTLNPAVTDYTDTQNPPDAFELIGLALGE